MPNAQIPKNYLGIKYFNIRHLLEIRNYNLEIIGVLILQNKFLVYDPIKNKTKYSLSPPNHL